MSRTGYIRAIGAFTLWGLFPLFWKLLEHLPPWEILGQRIFWGGIIFTGIAILGGKNRTLFQLFKNKDQLSWLILSGTLITLNWFIFIYLVVSGRVLEISLAYFINPIMNVFLGLAIFREKLNPRQWTALGFAAAGMILMAVRAITFPWMSLILASTFAFYGVLRKRGNRPTLEASAVEGIWMVCLALPGLVMYYTFSNDTAVIMHLKEVNTLTLFITGGFVTVIPVLLFASAARKLPLSTIGIIQYIAPSLQFGLAVFVFQEPFGWLKLQSFLLVWVGLLIYTIDLRIRYNQANMVTNDSREKVAGN